MFKDIFNAIYGCEYVPPCERNPWYDDPRDAKPSECAHTSHQAEETTESYSEQTVYEADDTTPNLGTVQQMYQCSKCGTFFIMEPPKTMIFGIPQIETLCHKCREKSLNSQLKDES